MSRFLIAFDPTAKTRRVYFRKTRCVTHDLTKGEAIYHAKPGSLTARRINLAIRMLKLVRDGRARP